jgi:hypothetical protein
VSNPEIEDYARVVMIGALRANGWPEGYQRRADYIEHIRTHVLPSLLNYDPRLSELTLNSLVEGLFEEMRAGEAFIPMKDRYAGEYLTVSPPHLKQFKDAALNSSSIQAMASSIGFERFFADVFAGFRQDPDIDRADLDQLPAPPTDDRSLTIEPSQIAAIRPPLDDLIDQVQADNGLPDFPNFRERVLGQIKAGREMLLSGCVRAQLLYWVLLRGLAELVEKYGQKAIGVAARHLIELLVDQVFKR